MNSPWQEEGVLVSRPIAMGVGILVLMLSSVSLAADEQTYEFRQNYHDGQAFKVLFSENIQLDAQSIYRGTVLHKVKIVDAIQQKGVVTIVETLYGVPVSQRIEVDKASGEFFQQSGKPASQEYGELAGKTIRVERGPNGSRLFKVDGEDYARRTPELATWLSRDTSIYPTHRVRLRQKWDLSDQVGYIRGFEGDQTVAAFGMLKSIKTLHDRPFAEVIVSIGMEGTLRKTKGLYMEVQLEGPALVDLVTGRIAKMDLTGEIHCVGAGDRHRGGAQLTFTGAGTIEFHQISIVDRHETPTATADARAKELP
jgi:hypothetical protein